MFEGARFDYFFENHFSRACFNLDLRVGYTKGGGGKESKRT